MNKNIFYNQNNRLKQIEKQRTDSILLNNILKIKSNINNNTKKFKTINKVNYKGKSKQENILIENKILIKKLSKINERSSNKYNNSNKTYNKFDFNKKRKIEKINKENIQLLKNINNQKSTIRYNSKIKIKKRNFSIKKPSLATSNSSDNNENFIEENIDKKVNIDNIEYSIEIIYKNNNESYVFLSIYSDDFCYTKNFNKTEWYKLFIINNKNCLNSLIISLKNEIEANNTEEDENIVNSLQNKKWAIDYNKNKEDLSNFICYLEQKNNDNFSSDFENN